MGEKMKESIPKVKSARLSSVLPCAGVPLPPTFDSLPLLSRPSIAARIARGELLVIHAPLVYRIPTAWLKLHPGGDMAILHYVGRDASNEIEVYHSGKTVAERMSRWVCGRVEVDEKEGWRDMVPPVQLSMWPIPVPTINVSDADADEAVEQLTQAEASVAAPRNLTPELVDPAISKEEEELLPLTPAYQQHLRESQRNLHKHLHELGLDTPPPFLSGYGPSLVIYISLFLLFVILFRNAHSTLGYLAASIALGLFWHQVTFFVHDADHTGITGDWQGDRIRSISVAGFLGGLSAGWWADNHNVHHLVTNSPEHDPDIQHMPFLAISTKFFHSLRSSYHSRVMDFDAFARFMVPLQHNLYYIIMCFARVNLFVLSYQFLLTKVPAKASPLFKLRIFEIVAIGTFWIWFTLVIKSIPGVWTRVMFVAVSFIVTSPLHVQIVLSHFSQPVSVASDIIPHTELLESYMHRQLRTTMDISCPPYLDFLHGGLNFQVEHHLFPRTPRFRFRQVAVEVEKWIKAEQELVKDGVWNGYKLKPNEGLLYKKMQFVEANQDVLGVLQSVGQQVKFFVEVAKADAKGELSHAH